ncbi:hypothetical protein [Actinomadura miaoliensis]|uniref:Chromosome segregation ATPase n=1 Tax=Actinomadura miaoliensis TaxID=430685 RepID=A0ABP7UUW5_9ACTN
MGVVTNSQETAGRGVVGVRHLVGLQTFDIARLTNHAVPIVPGTFVAVSGTGPQGDSNGSGKTSFLAAVSVLLADPQWRLSVNGGRYAANLLFKPDAAGLDPAQRFPPAPYGYIVGVFARSAEPGPDSVTVWVRVSASAPFVEARWAPGLHVADADNEAERILQADALWQQSEPKKPISARRMAEVLYGDAPRCLTYLDTQMRPRVPSLLSQQMTEMEPETIGDSLIALAGLDADLASETAQRGKFLQHESELATAVKNDTAARAEEEADLAGVAARQTARETIKQARGFWRRYLACRLHRAHDEDQRLEESTKAIKELRGEAENQRDQLSDRLAELRVPKRLIEDEEQKRRERDHLKASLEGVRAERATVTSRQTQLAEERPPLRSIAAGWSGTDADTARQTVTGRQHDLARASVNAERAMSEVEEAERGLHLAGAGLSGNPGKAIQILTEIGIEGIAVLDVVEPAPESRDAWEARLWPWRDAVAVPGERLADAAGYLTSRLPGTQLVGVPSDPQGRALSARGQEAVEDFLTNLDQQTDPSPSGIGFPSLNAVVVSGFDPPIAGRDTRVKAAEGRLSAARESLTEAQRAVAVEENRLKLAETDLEAALAAARLAKISAEERELDTKLVEIDDRLGALSEREEPAEAAWEEARLAVKSIEADFKTTQVLLDSAKEEVTRQRRALEGVERQREVLAVNVWLRLWGQGIEAATEVAAAEPTTTVDRPESLKRRASELLKEALRIFGVESDRDDLAPDLGEAAALRERFSDETDARGPSVIFDDVSAPLLARIAGAADNDQVITTRVSEQRRIRQELIDELEVEAETSAEVLKRLQEMLERHIERVLTLISKAYNRLDHQRGGSGALLDFTSVRPEGAGEWRWQVTPRWRRSRTGPPISYRETANSAQVKVQAIQLVLAAMLADSDPHGRVLVLDELGNSLGEVNRRDTLAALSKVAEEQQVTILGTCQDSVLTDAADYCGELLWFEHTTTSETYNQPTRAWGSDHNGARAALTADWIRHGRPPF